MNRIPVAHFTDRDEAESIRQRLARAGILAVIQEELWLQKLWYVSRGSAGVDLEVPAEQFDHTQKLLQSWELSEGALLHVVHCPQCRSVRVSYPQFARHSLLTNFAVGLCAELGLVEKDYYCEQCQFTWPKQATSPEHRAHLAPYYFIEGMPQAAAPPPPPSGPQH